MNELPYSQLIQQISALAARVDSADDFARTAVNYLADAFEVTRAELPERQGDSRDALDGRGGTAGDHVHVGPVRDQQRQAALRDGTATDDDDLPAGQAQADEVGVLGSHFALPLPLGRAVPPRVRVTRRA